MFRHPRTILLLVLLLLATACGARLTDEQREFALQGFHAEQSGAGPAGPTEQEPSGQGEIAIDVEAPADEEADGSQIDDAAPAAQDDAAAEGTEGAGDTGPAQPADDADASQPGPTDTREAPPGGNGGETDVGVSEDEIVLANVSDISGAVPGLFEPEQLAAQAYIQYFNASRGMLYGRSLSYLPLDSGLSSGGNRAASIEACERAFAAVGSMSAFDAGGAPVIEECGIPDIRTAATQPPMQVVANAYPISAGDPGLQPLVEYEWVTEEFPTAGENAAYVYIAGEVTAEATRKVREATAQYLGWDWIYVQEVDIAETNYAPFAREMAQRGVEFVTFQGETSQAARLAEAMHQQGFEPDVYMLQSNTYTPGLIERAPEAVEGTYITITSVMVEEAQGNEELQRYTQFLQQIAPGERPTSLGMYSWSAAKLFVEIAERVGPELTREAMLAELAKVDGWTGGGLHPPINVGGKEPAGCGIVLQVQGGEFARVHPSEGFECGSIVPVD